MPISNFDIDFALPIAMATSPLVFGCDTLSRQILDMYEDRRDKSFHKKMQIWRLVFVECWQTFGDCNVLPVGSTISGMGTDYSDLDLNLMIDGEVSEDRSIEMLETLLERWCDHPKFEEVSISELPSPIIRFEVDGVRAEIVIQENGGLDTESVRNTFLMMCYGDLDVRVRPLAVVLKRWASYNMLLGTMARRLSGFGLMLMLIFYLQQRHPHPDQVVDDSEDEADLEPPVLPCLQEKYPDLFHEKAKMFTHLDYIILEVRYAKTAGSFSFHFCLTFRGLWRTRAAILRVWERCSSGSSSTSGTSPLATAR